MKLSELQTALNNGFVIRRFGWEISKVSLNKNNNIILNKDDLEATDWYIVKDYLNSKFIGDYFDKNKAEEFLNRLKKVLIY